MLMNQTFSHTTLFRGSCPMDGKNSPPHGFFPWTSQWSTHSIKFSKGFDCEFSVGKLLSGLLHRKMFNWSFFSCFWNLCPLRTVNVADKFSNEFTLFFFSYSVRLEENASGCVSCRANPKVQDGSRQTGSRMISFREWHGNETAKANLMLSRINNSAMAHHVKRWHSFRMVYVSMTVNKPAISKTFVSWTFANCTKC